MSVATTHTTLERAFTPTWAGGWAWARVLFALAALAAHLDRVVSIRDALVAPTMVLASGPTVLAREVLMSGAAAWATWALGLVGIAGMLAGSRFARAGLLLWFVSHAGVLLGCGLNVRAPERLIVFLMVALLASPFAEPGLDQKARSPFARWLLLIVYASLYGSTGWMKLLEEPGWLSGEVLAYDLVDRWHAGGALAAWLSGHPLLCALLGWGTVAFEATFPFLVLFPPANPWVLLAGVAMHGTIGALMDVGALGTMAVAMYPVLLDPERGRLLSARLLARLPWLARVYR